MNMASCGTVLCGAAGTAYMTCIALGKTFLAILGLLP